MGIKGCSVFLPLPKHFDRRFHLTLIHIVISCNSLSSNSLQIRCVLLFAVMVSKTADQTQNMGPVVGKDKNVWLNLWLFSCPGRDYSQALLSGIIPLEYHKTVTGFSPKLDVLYITHNNIYCNQYAKKRQLQKNRLHFLTP